MTPRSLTESGLASLDAEVHVLMECLAEVLDSVGEKSLGAAVPWRGTDAPPPGDPEALAQLYSIAFQLLDMAEEHVALRVRQQRESSFGPGAEPGLWAHCLDGLQKAGLDAPAMAEAITGVEVEPVFTAHPTEAKRPSVLERHREIFRALLETVGRDSKNPGHSANRERLMAALEALWMTGEIHLERPTVERELRNALYYLRDVFPNAVREVDRTLAERWEEAGLDPAVLSEAGGGPRMRFGLWIGGDRDGHPFVTADVTRDTLGELRQQALKLYRRQLEAAAFYLTISAPALEIPPALTERVAFLGSALGAEGQAILERNPGEPFRAFAYLVRAAVGGDEIPDRAALEADLQLLKDSLHAVGAHRLATRHVSPMQRSLDVFGFHLAKLDIRQNSSFHDAAASQLMSAVGIPGAESFADWPEERRLAFLTEELTSPRPFLPAGHPAGTEADAVRDCFRVIADHRERSGPGVGALIVSMTRQVSDLLVVHLFAREAGLAISTPDGPTCPLMVVPLFETLDDLAGAGGIVDAYLTHPVTRRSLELQFPDGNMRQQVMLGYSDSNKDGGIIASQWGLQEAQEEIVATGRSHNVGIRFFHGRGGTISRGAGPTAWFLRAQPHGTLGTGFRMTEQGETIAKKYANPEAASYHLEALQASVARTSALHARPADEAAVRAPAAMPRLAEWSRLAYRELLESDGFLPFFRQATPIDALEQTTMGSRPSRRSGKPSLGDLRAIPWVFSWTQSRFYLPGWFGAGTALARLRDEDPAAHQELAEQIWAPTFARYLFSGIETNLISACPDIMRAYAGLVEDQDARDRLMNRIDEEYELTREGLGLLFRRTLAKRRPRMVKTLEIREDALRVLHLQQVELLGRWRKEGGDLPRSLLFTINAISSGLRTTG